MYILLPVTYMPAIKDVFTLERTINHGEVFRFLNFEELTRMLRAGCTEGWSYTVLLLKYFDYFFPYWHLADDQCITEYEESLPGARTCYVDSVYVGQEADISPRITPYGIEDNNLGLFALEGVDACYLEHVFEPYVDLTACDRWNIC